MIVCDKCKTENTGEIDLFKVYFYPQYMQIDQPYKMDICDKCLFEIMGKELFSEMLESFDDYSAKE